MNGSRGFTLLELIVVIAIFGVMSLMAYGGLASVLQSRVRVEQAMKRTAELQKAFMFLRNDFQQVQNRSARDSYGDLQPAFSADSQGNITMTRSGWTNPLSEQRSTLERVIYRYDAQKAALIRGSYRVLDLAQDSQPDEVQLLTHVDQVQWLYLDPLTRTWSPTWPETQTLNAQTSSQTSSPINSQISVQTNTNTATVAPPLAVELKLTTKDYGDLRFLFKLGPDPLPAGFTAGYVTSGSTGTSP